MFLSESISSEWPMRKQIVAVVAAQRRYLDDPKDCRPLDGLVVKIRHRQARPEVPGSKSGDVKGSTRPRAS
jgi:hypothetical protein